MLILYIVGKNASEVEAPHQRPSSLRSAPPSHRLPRNQSVRGRRPRLGTAATAIHEAPVGLAGQVLGLSDDAAPAGPAR